MWTEKAPQKSSLSGLSSRKRDSMGEKGNRYHARVFAFCFSVLLPQPRQSPEGSGHGEGGGSQAGAYTRERGNLSPTRGTTVSELVMNSLALSSLCSPTCLGPQTPWWEVPNKAPGFRPEDLSGGFRGTNFRY